VGEEARRLNLGGRGIRQRIPTGRGRKKLRGGKRVAGTRGGSVKRRFREKEGIIKP